MDGITAPLDGLAVRLEAAVGDDRNAVVAFHDDVGFLEALVGVAGELLAGCFAARASAN